MSENENGSSTPVSVHVDSPRFSFITHILDRIGWTLVNLRRRMSLSAMKRFSRSNLVQYAVNELDRSGLLDGGEENIRVADSVLSMVKEFSRGRHSGLLASYCLDIFDRLARFLPLTPLTGEDDEWVYISDGVYQNKRCPRVFKDKDHAYDVGASPAHTTPPTITFPYTPPIHPDSGQSDPPA